MVESSVRLYGIPLSHPVLGVRGMLERKGLTYRYVELLGEVHDHFPARQRAARFDKAQMTRRNIGLRGEQQLTHAPPLPPFTQKIADRASRCGRG